MQSKIFEKLKNINEREQKIVADFCSVIDDMGLEDDHKTIGLVYLAIKFGVMDAGELSSYPAQICQGVDVLQKIDNINYSQQIIEAENLRKMFFAITRDIRTIMIKIALVVAEVRNLGDVLDSEQIVFTHSIFSLYAPLAARLGLTPYKTELEERAFSLENPELKAKLEHEVEQKFIDHPHMVDHLVELVSNCMKELNIKGRVFGRKKHYYSIFKKLKDHPLDKIYDLIAVRAIVSTVAECYALLGKVHSVVEPIDNRFKDYIAIPKPNGYQSLHTTVKFEGLPVEIQIRTDEMNKYAEYGVAAHWIYKEKRKKQDTLDVSLAWIRMMMETENVSIDDLAKSLNEDIYGNDIFVQTPLGKVIYLPSGSTPIDFAYAIHSEVGNKCVGAKVNGKMVATGSTLNNGDVVEIITNPNSKGPSRDWLNFCKTSDARREINTFFKKNMKEENIRLGKTMLESAIKDKGFSIQKLMSKANLEEVCRQYNMQENEFFANLGTNALPVKVVANKLANLYQKQIKLANQSLPQETNIRIVAPSEQMVSIKGLNNILIKFANCCHPMFGDKIIGFISAGRGIIIHRSICPNISFYDENRLVEVGWKAQEVQPKSKTKKQNKTQKTEK